MLWMNAYLCQISRHTACAVRLFCLFWSAAAELLSYFWLLPFVFVLSQFPSPTNSHTPTSNPATALSPYSQCADNIFDHQLSDNVPTIIRTELFCRLIEAFFRNVGHLGTTISILRQQELEYCISSDFARPTPLRVTSQITNQARDHSTCENARKRQLHSLTTNDFVVVCRGSSRFFSQ